MLYDLTNEIIKVLNDFLTQYQSNYRRWYTYIEKTDEAKFYLTPIGELQKEYMTMELKLRGIKDPVIVMRNPLHTESNEKMPDGALRKKMLTKDLTPTRNEGYQLIYDNLLTKEARSNTGS